jgi:predicted nucleic acid-binding protein
VYAYYDTSVLLSLLLRDHNFAKASVLWSRFENRVSSTLLEVEALTVIRRIARQYETTLRDNWLSSKRELLNQYLKEISLKHFDADIIDLLRAQDNLGQCRTLDAIHLATTMLFKKVADASFYLCTFDKRMTRLAHELGFVIP